MKNVELTAGFKHLKEILFFYNYVCAETVFCVDAHSFLNLPRKDRNLGIRIKKTKYLPTSYTTTTSFWKQWLDSYDPVQDRLTGMGYNYLFLIRNILRFWSAY